MLVSVVIPVYNGERFVAAAIRSVLEQTHPKIECLVIDDGSADRTADVLSEFAGRITVIRQDNKGVAAARNAGAAAAHGEALAFLDADDVWLPHKLEQEVAALAATPGAVAAYCGLRIVDEDLRPLEDVAPPEPTEVLRNVLVLEPPVMSPSQATLVRRSAFAEVGGFDEGLSTSADMDFACRLALAGSLVRIAAPLVLYRTHGHQMHRDPVRFAQDVERVFDKIFPDPRLPPGVARLRHRAESNLRLTLCLEYAHARDWRGAGQAFASAVAADPRRTFVRVAALVTRRARRVLRPT